MAVLPRERCFGDIQPATIKANQKLSYSDLWVIEQFYSNTQNAGIEKVMGARTKMFASDIFPALVAAGLGLYVARHDWGSRRGLGMACSGPWGTGSGGLPLLSAAAQCCSVLLSAAQCCSVLLLRHSCCRCSLLAPKITFCILRPPILCSLHMSIKQRLFIVQEPQWISFEGVPPSVTIQYPTLYPDSGVLWPRHSQRLWHRWYLFAQILFFFCQRFIRFGMMIS